MGRGGREGGVGILRNGSYQTVVKQSPEHEYESVNLMFGRNSIDVLKRKE